LENSYILIIALSDKNISRSDKLKISNLDELDTASSRLTNAVLDNKSLSETLAQGDVLSNDERRRERVKSVRGFEVAVGTATPLSNALGAKEVMWAFGMGQAYDVGEAFIEVRWDILSHFGDFSGTYNAFTLGGNYIWKDDGRTAFFSGGHFGFGHSKEDVYGSGSGFHFGLDTGVLFFRQADVNLELRLRYMVMAKSLKDSYPQLGSLVLGIHL
jgi:hypothetical protein